jgi:hypothetical protein
MKKVWILLAIAGLLLLWSFVRERFEATASIKAPPYGKEDKIRMFEMVNQKSPRPPYTPLGYQDILMDKAKALAPKETDVNKLKEAAGGLVAPAVESFFTTVFKPATVPITEANIDTFLSTRSSDIKMIEKDILTTYFVGQSGVGTSTNTGYAAALAELGQNPGYLTLQGATPKGMSTNAAPVSGADGGPLTGGLMTGGPLAGGTGDTSSMTSAGNVPGGGMGTTTGSTTGGGSTSSMGPTSGNSGNRAKQVFGPIFTGQGAGSGGGQVGDSSKTNKYPELMGGMVDSSTRIPGVGVVEPSKNWKLAQDGSLPSADSLGSTEESKFFPTSRSPGDMDLIPDPYRLSRNFSTSSYSSKTEPVPFLTDFSAFLK